ncbi:energy-coupling factor transporter transmembrane component T family protein [Populibacterium corticicola]|uniref:Energy-coupling factor transporter transmembrane component T family protein n=1 Tax=Populibacterium corticicola TaxID=1812826 RepID=A0ABW5XEF3_9MICO
MNTAPAPYLDRRNPTVKLTVLLVLSLFTLTMFDPVATAIVLFGTLMVVTLGLRVKLREMALFLVPFMVFGIGVIGVNTVTRPGTELFALAGVSFTREGALFGIAMAVRALIVGVMTVAFIASTRPRDLMVSLQQHARLSPRYSYALMAGHRMLESLPQQWATIRAAHAVRAARGKDGTARFGVRDFARCAFALLVGSIRHSERVALALELRGLRPGPRSVWKPVALTSRDWLFAGGALLAFGALTWLGASASPLA